MPRRNVHPEPPADLPAREALNIPKPPPAYKTREQAEAERDERAKHRRMRRDAEETILIRATTQCVWPLCEHKPDRRPDPIPVCAHHAYTIWSQFEDRPDQKPLTEHRLNRQLETRARIQREDAERESRSQSPGWVYYVRIGEQIKIGYSTDVKQRMKAYPPEAELLAVHLGTLTLEAAMHDRFAAARAAGREWFHPHDDLMAHIADALTQFGNPSRFAHKYRAGTAQRVKPKARRPRRL